MSIIAAAAAGCGRSHCEMPVVSKDLAEQLDAMSPEEAATLLTRGLNELRNEGALALLVEGVINHIESPTTARNAQIVGPSVVYLALEMEHHRRHENQCAGRLFVSREVANQIMLFGERGRMSDELNAAKRRLEARDPRLYNYLNHHLLFEREKPPVAGVLGASLMYSVYLCSVGVLQPSGTPREDSPKKVPRWKKSTEDAPLLQGDIRPLKPRGWRSLSPSDRLDGVTWLASVRVPAAV